MGNNKLVIGVSVLMLVGVSVTIGTAYLLSNTNSTAPRGSFASERDLAEIDITSNTSDTAVNTPTPTPTATPEPTPAPLTNTSGITPNDWSYAGFQDVVVDVEYFESTSEAIIYFYRLNFDDIETITYNFSYVNNSNSYSVQSTVDPMSSAIKKSAGSDYYLTKTIYLGSCSQDVCTNHDNLSNLKLSVTTKRKITNDEYSQTLTKESL